ncbi:hypothetical protein JT651_004382 [Escherichia coli]|nr:hypothetical protein [Escherichia coli]EHC2080240.1 hypothetical protein [Escherichia coli]EJW5741980.1 hypothetical protein [Escherichia coli]MBB8114954.1 hypothetical protein [Escherichia coli]
MASFSGEGFRDIVDFTVFRNRRYTGTKSVPPAKFEGSASGFFFLVTAESFHGRLAYLPLTGLRDFQGGRLQDIFREKVRK